MKMNRQDNMIFTPFLNWAKQPLVLFGMSLIFIQLAMFHFGISILMGDEGSLSSSLVFQSQQGRSLASDNSNNRHDIVEGVMNLEKRGKLKYFTVNDDAADGTFSGYPIYLKENQKHVETVPHCVGENYQQDKYGCIGRANSAFFVSTKMYKHVEVRPFLDISQSYLQQTKDKKNTVSLGGINLKWGMRNETGIPRLEWFPEIRRLGPGETLSYYELPPSVVMVPFHSMNAANPGHLVWDDFLPIYTLLTMFQLERRTDLLMMRYILKDGVRGLWASCDYTDEKKNDCKTMQRKFLPLMLGMDPVHKDMPTTEEFDFQVKQGTEPKSTLVCAAHGLAGMGALTDHGTRKLHGWEDADYETTQNHGRGGMLYEFRNFMLNNIAIPTEYQQKPPFRIVFSEQSSNIGHRNLDFTLQKQMIQESFNPSYVMVESYVFSRLTLYQQLDIASKTSIFITTCGGGAVTSMFMPRGSSVLMYYLEYGGVVAGRQTGKPARLDWDLFNNMAHLKVHWLPVGTMHEESDLRAFLFLIQHELDGLIREKSYDHFFN
eukprot:CAMPEP_0178850864 /NCGR_PEP_ID=MMETSP0746-20121128/20784_1 /TAXON_ID=913974 /ORGANISM="Nitzschia punctata, Strain CCMP561" /LENGTH=545 /DNA_ID=CAMNT_0020516327 /DNA_START=35 /DNA_END=1673 /DNA_ORIENTATION=+